MNDELRVISKNGLWSNNPALVQLLGLCPLLAVSNSLVTSIGLGLATILVLTASNGLVALIRNHVDSATRLPLYILIIASFVTGVDILLQAWAFELHQRISLFVALIVTNCVLLGRAESFASKNPVLISLYDGLMMGAGFMSVLVIMGFIRELLGRGTLFANMDLLFGEAAKNWTLHIGDGQSGFLLAVLPPGAFILLGFMIALKNVVDARLLKSDRQQSVARVRFDSPELS